MKSAAELITEAVSVADPAEEAVEGKTKQIIAGVAAYAADASVNPVIKSGALGHLVDWVQKLRVSSTIDPSTAMSSGGLVLSGINTDALTDAEAGLLDAAMRELRFTGTRAEFFARVKGVVETAGVRVTEVEEINEQLRTRIQGLQEELLDGGNPDDPNSWAALRVEHGTLASTNNTLARENTEQKAMIKAIGTALGIDFSAIDIADVKSTIAARISALEDAAKATVTAPAVDTVALEAAAKLVVINAVKPFIEAVEAAGDTPVAKDDHKNGRKIGTLLNGKGVTVDIRNNARKSVGMPDVVTTT